MAKAKKPASVSKSTSQLPKDSAVKADAATVGNVGSTAATGAKAAQASSAKTDKAVDNTPSSADVAKPAAVKGVESDSAKTTKAVEAKSAAPAALKDEPSKGSEAKAADAAKVSDAAKDTTAKPAVSGSAPKQEAPRQEPEKQGSIFWPLIFGGVIAGGIGFLVSQLNAPGAAVDTTGLKTALSAQQERIATLESAEAPDVEIPGLEGIQNGIASLSEMVTTLEERLAKLESRPLPSAGDNGPSPEYAEGLAALQSSVEVQKNEIEKLLRNAQSVEEATANAARQAVVQGALTKITVALNSGEGFSEAVAQLSANGVDDVPAVLTENAADGVATLLSLQTGFAGAARAALSSARAAGTDQSEGGVGAFIKRQLGARSVAPREGSDTDAVLSRAEAAVRDGRVTDALAEIDVLPAPAQDAMADWLASARSRAAAATALQDLSQRLTAN